MDKAVGKLLIAILCTIFFQSLLTCAEKMPLTYQISYGDPKAPIHITEYFSLSCPKCIKCFLKDFKKLNDRYIKTGHVYFRFHPHPADLLTLQAMVCLEKLEPPDKIIFWEVFIERLKDLSEGCQVMQFTMDALEKPLPLLNQLDYLEKTHAFNMAYHYLSQRNIVREVPTVEINGTIYDEFPHFRFIEKKIKSLLPSRI